MFFVFFFSLRLDDLEVSILSGLSRLINFEALLGSVDVLFTEHLFDKFQFNVFLLAFFLGNLISLYFFPLVRLLSAFFLSSLLVVFLAVVANDVETF